MVGDAVMVEVGDGLGERVTIGPNVVGSDVLEKGGGLRGELEVGGFHRPSNSGGGERPAGGNTGSEEHGSCREGEGRNRAGWEGVGGARGGGWLWV